VGSAFLFAYGMAISCGDASGRCLKPTPYSFLWLSMVAALFCWRTLSMILWRLYMSPPYSCRDARVSCGSVFAPPLRCWTDVKRFTVALGFAVQQNRGHGVGIPGCSCLFLHNAFALPFRWQLLRWTASLRIQPSCYATISLSFLLRLEFLPSSLWYRLHYQQLHYDEQTAACRRRVCHTHPSCADLRPGGTGAAGGRL